MLTLILLHTCPHSSMLVSQTCDWNTVRTRWHQALINAYGPLLLTIRASYELMTYIYMTYIVYGYYDKAIMPLCKHPLPCEGWVCRNIDNPRTSNTMLYVLYGEIFYHLYYIIGETDYWSQFQIALQSCELRGMRKSCVLLPFLTWQLIVEPRMRVVEFVLLVATIFSFIGNAIVHATPNNVTVMH